MRRILYTELDKISQQTASGSNLPTWVGSHVGFTDKRASGLRSAVKWYQLAVVRPQLVGMSVSTGIERNTDVTPKPGRLSPGDVIDVRQLDTVGSGQVPVPDPQRLTHLQFRRYAGCPICNLHLRSFGRRHGELEAAGIREIAVFHSSTKAMTEYQDTLPFALIADPQRTLYREFGVERSLRAVAHPRAWAAAARGWNRHLPPQSDTGDGGHTGLPADFLIAPDGRIVACKYGAHADDQWSFDEVLAQARPQTGA